MLVLGSLVVVVAALCYCDLSSDSIKDFNQLLCQTAQALQAVFTVPLAKEAQICLFFSEHL